MAVIIPSPKPIFDTLEHVIALYEEIKNSNEAISTWLKQCFSDEKATLPTFPEFAMEEFRWALNFLYSYRGSPDRGTKPKHSICHQLACN